MRQNWQMWSGRFDANFVSTVSDLAGNVQNAETFNNAGDDIRKSKVAWLSNSDYLLTTLFDFVDFSNRSAFNFSIYKKADIQYTEYHGSEGGHYSWHHDVDWNRDDGLDRKLSVVVQLSDPSDYEGGEFSFGETENPNQDEFKKLGSILIFPSYLQHSVSPVTSGIRKSLVAWFEGPTWR